VQIVPTEHLTSDQGFPLLYHDLHTNGVIYLDLAFDTSAVDRKLLQLLPLFGQAVRGSGLPGQPYYDVARRLSLRTGGFGAVLSADTSVLPARSVEARLVFRVKMLEQNLEVAVDLVRDLLLEADFRDFDRLRTIVREMRNDLKASLVPGGSHYAALRAAAHLSGAAAIDEQWKGISQYVWLDTLSRRREGNLAELAAALEALRAELIRPSLLTLNLTCGQPTVRRAVRVAADVVGALEKGGSGEGDPGRFAALFPAELMPSCSVETMVGSMNVSFVAHLMPGSRFGEAENAHEGALAHFLSTGFLWERIRMRGGAYGAGASANGLEGLFGFSSYRDPNTLDTLDAFREALRFASSADLDSKAFEKIVLGAAGKEDRPMAPGEKDFVALKREILGITDAQRQARRDALIDCTPKQLKTAAERLLDRFDSGATAIVTNLKALEQHKRRLKALNASALKLPD
jgi:hypothetical protein